MSCFLAAACKFASVITDEEETDACVLVASGSISCAAPQHVENCEEDC